MILQDLMRQDGFNITTNFRLNLHHDERDDRRWQCEITKDGEIRGFAVEDTAAVAVILAAAKAGYHKSTKK